MIVPHHRDIIEGEREIFKFFLEKFLFPSRNRSVRFLTYLQDIVVNGCKRLVSDSAFITAKSDFCPHFLDSLLYNILQSVKFSSHVPEEVLQRAYSVLF
jgi:hypothetical protein